MKVKLINLSNPPEVYPYTHFYFLPLVSIVAGNGEFYLYIGWLFYLLTIDLSKKLESDKRILLNRD